MQFTVYGNTGKSVVYPLLLDVTSDIIGQLNRRIVIPLRKSALSRIAIERTEKSRQFFIKGFNFKAAYEQANVLHRKLIYKLQ